MAVEFDEEDWRRSVRGSEDAARPAFAPATTATTGKYSPKTIVYFIIAVGFVIMSGNGLTSVPAIRIFEDNICRHYYEKNPGTLTRLLQDPIDESLCKGQKVQGELAVLKGVWAMMDAIPGLLLAFPYGLLADRIGRKPVFGLAITGVMMTGLGLCVICWFWETFPIRLIWATPIFLIIGGGNSVVRSMLFTMMADVTPAEDRANAFFRFMVAAIAGEIVSPSIASALMVKSPWIPLILGICTIIFGASLIAFIPETLNMRQSLANPTEGRRRSSHGVEAQSSTFGIRDQIRKAIRDLPKSTYMLRTRPILLLLSTFVINQLTFQFATFSTQYVSAQFSWSLAQAGYLTSMRATIIILLLLAILPLSFKALERYKIIDNRRDLYLARASILFYALGSLLVSVPNIGIVIIGLITFSFGAGFESLCRSLITSLVDHEHTGRLYAVISVIDTLGAFMAPLLMAGLFNLGLKDGGWLGLPFFGAACVMSAIAVVVWAVRLPQPKEDDSAGLLPAYTDVDVDGEDVSIHEMNDDLIDIDRA